jgi:alpha-aminoadipate/glutamate carrier protein LysW
MQEILNIKGRTVLLFSAVRAPNRLEDVTMVMCPECESDLDIEEEEVDEGEVVSCPECGTDFEVVAIEPLELSKVDDDDIDDDEDVEDDKEEE